VTLGAHTTFGYLSQLRDGLDPRRSIRENVLGDRGHLVLGGEPMELHSYLARFLFQGAIIEQPVSALSGGERTRVALAVLLARPSSLLILDEPTNDLDVQTISAVEELLVEFEGSALVVTHDRSFLDRVATDILAFQGDGRVLHYAGNYEDYRTLRGEEQRDDEREKGSSGAMKPARVERTRVKPNGLTYAERLELEAIADRIEAAEALVRSLEEQLVAPALYARADGHKEATLISAQLDQAKAGAADLVARWETLEEKREG
jgi:ATP-binding cassette subfamily F protein uup